MRLTVGKQILGACLALVLLFSLLNSYVFWETGHTSAIFNDLLARVDQLKTGGSEVQIQLYKQSSFARTYYLTGDPRYEQSYNQAKQDMWKAIDDLAHHLTTDEGKGKLNEMKKTLQEYNQGVDTAISIRKTKGETAVIQFLPTIVREVEAAEKESNAFNEYLHSYAETRRSAVDKEIKNTEGTMLAINAGAILLAILIAAAISHRIARPLQEVALAAGKIAEGNLTPQNLSYAGNDEISDMIRSFHTMSLRLCRTVQSITQTAGTVTSASQQLLAVSEESAGAAAQIADHIAQVTGGADRQSAAIHPTLHQVEEISSAISCIAQTANRASRCSAETSAAAETGRSAMKEAAEQMQEISHTVTDSVATVQKLGQRSQQIGEIITVIGGIASQTNLLALNAAIEAARAGEQGRGFAVVAEEVRLLAEQAQASAKEIGAIIGAVQSDTANTVQAMEKGLTEVEEGTRIFSNTDEKFIQIDHMIHQLNSQVQEISSTAEKLHNASQAVGTAMETIGQIAASTSQNAHSITEASKDQSTAMEEVAASSQSLAQMAEGLQSQLSEFHYS